MVSLFDKFDPKKIVQRQREAQAKTNLQKQLAEMRAEQKYKSKIQKLSKPKTVTKKGKLNPKALKKLFKSSKKFKTAQLRKNLLKAGRYPRLQKKRSLSPAQIMQLRRLQQLKKIQGNSNLNQKLVYQQLQLEKQKQLQQARLRHSQQSPSLRHQLQQLKAIQNRAKMQDMAKQRQLREARILSDSMNLMKAHKNMNKVDLDFTGVNPDENILMSKNIFKQDKLNNPSIFRKRGFSILDTKGAGNDLMF